MDAEYITAKLATLPQFTVEHIDHGPGQYGNAAKLIGSVTGNLPSSDQSIGAFFPDLEFIDGLVTSAQEDLWYRTIEVSEDAFEAWRDRLLVGSRLALFPYDRRRLMLVIDPTLQWQRVEFTPQKAIVQRIVGTDGKPYFKSSLYREGDIVPAEAWIEEGSWDHEHCIFCWSNIDADHVGYNSAPSLEGEWVCGWCYTQAIYPNAPEALWTEYKERK